MVNLVDHADARGQPNATVQSTGNNVSAKQEGRHPGSGQSGPANFNLPVEADDTIVIRSNRAKL